MTIIVLILSSKYKKIQLLEHYGYSGKIIYIDYYLPTETLQTKSTLTLKVKSSNNNDLIEIYSMAYDTIQYYATNIGTFTTTLWDYSVETWSDFTSTCRAYKDSITFLLHFADIIDTDKILDIGAGSGEISEYIAKLIPKGELTVLDASPHMIEKSRSILSHYNNVSYALCHLPVHESNCDIDLIVKKYNKIIFHLSLLSHNTSIDDIKKIATWCKKYLVKDGIIVLSALNTAVEMEQSEQFNNWNDTFISQLKNIASALQLEKYIRDENYNLLKQDEIENIFSSIGFILTKKEAKHYEFSMEERILMWKSPAVIDSFIDVFGYGIKKSKELVDSIAKKIKGEITKDITATYWLFENYRQ